jgi:mono/diheme cytochrome c family protein
MQKRLFVGITALAVGMVVSATFSYAQPADIGKTEYVNNCAVCHGTSGKGNGPLIELLRKSPTDLTIIQKNTSGVFPFDRIYAVIDGREVVPAHGPRDMPVWGDVYSARGAASSFGYASPKELESFAQGRIIALIGYIYTLQSK